MPGEDGIEALRVTSHLRAKRISAAIRISVTSLTIVLIRFSCVCALSHLIILEPLHQNA